MAFSSEPTATALMHLSQKSQQFKTQTFIQHHNKKAIPIIIYCYLGMS